jgi:hypothetical protein
MITLAKISYKSFFLGMGIGLFLSSSINILLDVAKNNEINNIYSKHTYTKSLNNEDLSNKQNQYNEKKDYFIFMIDSDDSIDTIINKLNKDGYFADYNELKKLIGSRKLKEGIYKVYYQNSLEDIIELITINNKKEQTN